MMRMRPFEYKAAKNITIDLKSNLASEETILSFKGIVLQIFNCNYIEWISKSLCNFQSILLNSGMTIEIKGAPVNFRSLLKIVNMQF